MTAPPGSVRPEISWTSAFHACFAASLGCVAQGNAVVSLAVVTGPGNATIGGRSMFENSLTYVVVWDSGACIPPGRAGAQCHEVDLVTAQDGNVPAGTHAYTFEVLDSVPVPTA